MTLIVPLTHFVLHPAILQQITLESWPPPLSWPADIGLAICLHKHTIISYMLHILCFCPNDDVCAPSRRMVWSSPISLGASVVMVLVTITRRKTLDSAVMTMWAEKYH
jgi:hypothetical protein